MNIIMGKLSMVPPWWTTSDILVGIVSGNFMPTMIVSRKRCDSETLVSPVSSKQFR
jgi:hypothetical protein